MKLLGLEITKWKKKARRRTVACYHCGRKLFVSVENVRAYNYCSKC